MAHYSDSREDSDSREGPQVAGTLSRIAPETGAIVLIVAIFAVTEYSGPTWDEALPRREQVAWDEHGAFMDGLLDEGFVILGGPIGEGDDERALVIVSAADESEVEARFAEDPWISMGVLRIGAIEPWSIWLGGFGSPRDG